MIKLAAPGERGGELTVTMTPFDVLSLQEGLNFANNHLKHLQEEHKDEPNWPLKDYVEVKLKDVLANFRELEAVLANREEALRV